MAVQAAQGLMGAALGRCVRECVHLNSASPLVPLSIVDRPVERREYLPARCDVSLTPQQPAGGSRVALAISATM